MRPSRFQRRVAIPLMLVAMAALLQPPAWATGAASLSGRVLLADGISPGSGLVVTLFDARADRMFRSAPTNDDGAFRIDQAPAGEYSLLVEVEQGAYVSPDLVTLESGDNVPLALTLQSTAPGFAMDSGLGQGGLPPAVRWIVVGLIAATALFVISEIGEDTQEAASSAF